MDVKDKRFYVFAAVAIVALVAVALVNLIQAAGSGPTAKTISYSQFVTDVAAGRVRSVIMAGQQIAGVLDDKTAFKTFAPSDPDLVHMLREKGVAIVAAAPPDDGHSFIAILTTLLPTLLLVGFAIYFIGRMPGAGGKQMGLGKSKARRLEPTPDAVTFADVAGVDEARESLQEIVDFLRDPQKFQRLGGRIPSGVLLVGPPGSGKTLLARAIAGEAKAPFFSISGSDFVEMFVGVGASRVRDMFNAAKKSAPCIIFMDEIDAVGRKRGAGLGSGSDEREQTLNQLLVEMDGFESTSGIILIAATNRPDVLDPALLRPGRFDREIVVAKPDVRGREHILKVHVRKVPLGPDVDLAAVARRTPGFTGAELMNLVNEAALLAARRAGQSVGMKEFEDAMDIVTMGVERRTHVMTEDERRLTAYREGGRAIVALAVPAADPVHKATIIPRGRSAGMVSQRPDDDQKSSTLQQLTSRLAILMAGRVSEEITFGPDRVTSISAGDIEEATALARSMVTRWGLSPELGVMAYGENQDEVFLGHSVARRQDISERTAEAITVEMRKFIDAAIADARQILTSRRGQLEALAQALLERETLSGDEIRAIFAGTPQPD
ncbi:MAG TPA: ATP-dependent zinc metalloprotease FtsH [Hyphomonadaceae bacterium]|jgi:cell division protease FtsH|nr:ATP-dependent zinc metalloprotease FtsH [Hyphomonadaceae bacterium]